MEQLAQALAVILSGAALGWIGLFSFVVAPVAFSTFDPGRAERLVKQVMNSGHGVLAVIAIASGLFAFWAGAVAGASVAAVAGVLAFLCKFALAPREDRPLKGSRVLKTARVVASGLTAFLIPLLVVAIVLMLRKI